MLSRINTISLPVVGSEFAIIHEAIYPYTCCVFDWQENS